MLSVKGYASDEMEHNYRRAKDLSQEHSDSVHQFRAIWGLWVFHLVRGQLANARDLAENLLALANREQSSDLLIEAHRILGTTCFFLGRFDEARTHLLTAKSLDDPTQHRSQALLYGQDPGITARIYLASTFWILGEVEQAETLALEAIGMARELEHPFTRGFYLSLSFLDLFHSPQSRIERWSSPTKPLRFRHNTHLNWVWRWRRPIKAGRWPKMGKRKVSASFINGLSAIRVTGAGLNNTFTLALLAEIYLRNNRIEEGLGTIEEAQKLAVTGGELFWQAELLRLKGELLLGQSDQSVQAAEQCFCEALKIAQDQHAKMLELRAATSLAKLWRKLNKSDDAKRILHSVYSRFTEGVDNRDMIEAKTVLQQLSV